MRSSRPPAPPPASPAAESTVPSASEMVTWSAGRSGTEEETRLMIGLHLAVGQRAPGAGVDQHRGGGGAGLVVEDGLLRDRQVHHRGAHPADALHGGGQLALDGALVGDLLLELAGGHALLVQQGVPAVGAAGQAGGGGLQPLRGDDLLGDHDRGAAVLELVLHAVAAELVDDRRGVGGGQVGEQRGERGGHRDAVQRGAAEHEHGHADHREHLLAGGEAGHGGAHGAGADDQGVRHQLRPASS